MLLYLSCRNFECCGLGWGGSACCCSLDNLHRCLVLNVSGLSESLFRNSILLHWVAVNLVVLEPSLGLNSLWDILVTCICLAYSLKGFWLACVTQIAIEFIVLGLSLRKLWSVLWTNTLVCLFLWTVNPWGLLVIPTSILDRFSQQHIWVKTQYTGHIVLLDWLTCSLPFFTLISTYFAHVYTFFLLQWLWL